MNILIVGGGGLIGSGLTTLLLNDGHKVIILDNFICSQQGNVDKRATLITGSATNYAILNNVFSSFKPEIVFHLADNVVDKDGIYSFTDEADTSISILSNILRCINLYGIVYLFLGSSCEVYPSKNNREISEDVSTGVYSYTGNVKLFSENMVRFFAPAKKINYTFLRYFQVYGNRRFINPKFDLATNLLDIILRKQGVVLVGPKLYIDMLSGEDASEATKLVLDKVFLGEKIDTINIASGSAIKIEDLYKTIINKLNITDLKVYNIKPRQQNRSLVADITKLKSLGWEPKRNFNDDLDNLIDFRKGLIYARR